VETRNRKPLEPNELADWELRIGTYRVFYDIDLTETTVKIKAIGHKDRTVLYLRGKEHSP
jgi:mRNA-degrading endonuclease RelE of RelBE toxin-antitoxin system